MNKTIEKAANEFIDYLKKFKTTSLNQIAPLEYEFIDPVYPDYRDEISVNTVMNIFHNQDYENEYDLLSAIMDEIEPLGYHSDETMSYLINDFISFLKNHKENNLYKELCEHFELEDFETGELEQHLINEFNEYDVLTISADFTPIAERYLNQYIKVAINDITKEDLNTDLSSLYDLFHNTDIAQLIKITEDKKSTIDEDTRKELYSDLNDYLETDNGFLRLLASQGLNLKVLSSNEKFEQFAQENSEFLTQISREIDEGSTQYSMNVCYLATMTVKEALMTMKQAQLQSEKNFNDTKQVLVIKSGDIYAGFFNAMAGSGSIFGIEQIKNDIVIPMEDVKLQIIGAKDNLLGYEPDEVYGFTSEVFEITETYSRKAQPEDLKPVMDQFKERKPIQNNSSKLKM